MKIDRSGSELKLKNHSNKDVERSLPKGKLGQIIASVKKAVFGAALSTMALTGAAGCDQQDKSDPAKSGDVCQNMQEYPLKTGIIVPDLQGNKLDITYANEADEYKKLRVLIHYMVENQVKKDDLPHLEAEAGAQKIKIYKLQGSGVNVKDIVRIEFFIPGCDNPVRVQDLDMDAVKKIQDDLNGMDTSQIPQYINDNPSVLKGIFEDNKSENLNA